MLSTQKEIEHIKTIKYRKDNDDWQLLDDKKYQFSIVDSVSYIVIENILNVDGCKYSVQVDFYDRNKELITTSCEDIKAFGKVIYFLKLWT